MQSLHISFYTNHMIKCTYMAIPTVNTLKLTFAFQLYNIATIAAGYFEMT